MQCRQLLPLFLAEMEPCFLHSTRPLWFNSLELSPDSDRAVLWPCLFWQSQGQILTRWSRTHYLLRQRIVHRCITGRPVALAGSLIHVQRKEASTPGILWIWPLWDSAGFLADSKATPQNCNAAVI
jgi:hypothetical protein